MALPTPEATPVSAKTADDINDLFNTIDDEPAKPEKPSKDTLDLKETKETKEIKDDEEIELVDDDEDPEKLDLTKDDDDINIDAPPRKKEILAKYPDVFKDFPFLEKIMYRDKQYSEMFGSFDDAKEIAEKSEVFDEFNTQLLSGNTVDVLKNVKEADPKAFDKIVDNYLVSLAKVDKDAYFEVIGNLSKRLIMDMFEEGKNSGNDELQQAALIVNQFLFNSSKFVAPKARVGVNADENAQSEAEKERLSFVQERFESSRDELQNKVDNVLKATISDYIDPKGSMSAYVKKNAVADALKLLNSSLVNDESLKRTLDKLWKGAFDAKFSKESLGKIQSYYLSKAKGVLPTAIKKARAEALKDAAPRVQNEKEEVESRPRRGSIPAGGPSRQSGKNEMKKGESVSDFFARD